MSDPAENSSLPSTARTSSLRPSMKEKATHTSRARLTLFHLLRNMRGRFDRLIFRARDRLSFTILAMSYISTLLGLAGLIGIIQSPTFIRWLFFLWATFVSVVNSTKAFSDKIERSVDKINPEYARFVHKLAQKSRDLKGAVVIQDDGRRDHGYLYTDFFPEYLVNLVSIEPTPFQVPDVVEKHADFLIAQEGAGVVNEAKVRLATDIQDLAADPSAPVVLQRTCYFHDRVTNNLARKRIVAGSEVIHGHRFMTDGDELVSLQHAVELSNQLGGSTMLVTADRKLVYVEQGSGALENPSRYASTGSGSFDWKTLQEFVKQKRDLSYADFARQEMERELFEEVGVDLTADHRTLLAGFGRYLYRNGKPEMLGLTVTTQGSRDLKVRYQERTFIRKELCFFDIARLDGPATQQALNRLHDKLRTESKGNSRLSVPLIMNLMAASNFIEHELDKGRDPIRSFYG